jgi:hypothetical protein
MFDLLTDGGLHHIHFVGRAPEMELLGSSHKIPD